MAKSITCQKCGKECVLGVNATRYGCDECTGVKRDEKGYIWLPGEDVHTYKDLETGEIWTVTRAEALGE
jgi:hypothetical protein